MNYHFFIFYFPFKQMKMMKKTHVYYLIMTCLLMNKMSLNNDLCSLLHSPLPLRNHLVIQNHHCFYYLRTNYFPQGINQPLMLVSFIWDEQDEYLFFQHHLILFFLFLLKRDYVKVMHFRVERYMVIEKGKEQRKGFKEY
jgi:hypothetical protein